MWRKIKIRFNQLHIFTKYLYYYFYCNFFGISNNEVWLISERGIDARDNGFAFYNYMVKNHSEIDVRYIISQSSPDYDKVKKIGKYILYGSREHYILFITSGILISTHLMGFSPNMGLFNKLNKKGFLKVNGKLISLAHGIKKDYYPQIDPVYSKIDLQICGAKPEYKYMLKSYSFTKFNLKCTGLARYDNLISKPLNQILIMPTFRSWMAYYDDEEFIMSKYYRVYAELLNDKKLLYLLSKYNMKLVFYPHIEFQKYLHLFKSNNDKIIIASINDYDVQKLLINSKVLVTDYSSVFFDFAYMKKPVIYYQFDVDEYRGKHYKEGYFKYERDGFGKVLKDNYSVVNELESILDKNCQIESLYLKKIDDFFEYTDRNNCKRIFEVINDKMQSHNRKEDNYEE